MTSDDSQALAKYFKQRPDAMEQVRRSAQSMVSQYKLAASPMAQLAKSVADVQKMAAEALKAAYMPVDLLSRFREQMMEVFPANWRGVGVDLGLMEEILETDGIPIVHIPRAEIVKAILEANAYESRLAVLRDHNDDVIEDCRMALADDYHESMSAQIPLARRAIEAYQAGFYEAAQALAVTVCDTYLKQLFLPAPNRRAISYDRMAERLSISASEEVGIAFALNVYYALSPAVVFLMKWFPGDAVDPQNKLSRHQSIHNASVEQMTMENATIALMYLTSMSVALNWARGRSSSPTS